MNGGLSMSYSFNFSRSSSDLLLTTSEILLLVFGLIVAAAIVGEYREDKQESSWIPDIRKRLPWKKVWQWAVIGGVLGEAMSDGGVWLASERLQSISDKETADLKVEESKANERAAQANERAGNLEAEAADAKKQIAQAQNDTAKANERAADAALALELLKAPRSLTPEDSKAILAKIEPYSGQKFGPGITPSVESLAFMHLVKRLLQDAGWEEVRRNISLAAPSTDGAADVIIDGIQVSVRHNADSKTAEAAKALLSSLNNAHLYANASYEDALINDASTILVTVGSKPINPPAK